MKKCYFLLSIIFTSSISMAQIPNSGFETWTTTGSYSTPDGWDNLNAMTSMVNVYTCMKGTPGAVGNSCLQLTSKSVAGMGVMPGVAVSGKINMVTMTASSGFAFSQRPQSLTGKWQYMASGNDMGFIAVYLTKWNSTTKHRDTIAKQNQALSGMVMSWASFTINLTYKKGVNPDSAVIILSSSGMTPVANSYLYVDDLAFSGSVASILNPSASLQSDLVIYPNPVSGNTLNISFTNEVTENTIYTIYDMQGRALLTRGAINSNSGILDIRDLIHGTYIIELKSENGIMRKLLLRQ